MRFVWGVMLAALLVGCKAAAPVRQANYDSLPAGASPAVGDMLVGTLGGDPTNLVPWLSGESAGGTVAGNIYNALLKYDANLNLVPDLAARWAFSDGGRTLTFWLKDGLHWSNGKPLTSADVLATWKAITDPTTRTPYAGDYVLVTKAETPDSKTFVVRYAEPLVTTLASWASLSIVPKHVLDKTADVNATTLKEHPLGSGPYVLATWVRGQYVDLRRDPTAWQTAWIGGLRYRVLPDPATQWLELKAGNIDLADLSPLQYTRLTDAPWFTRNYTKISYLSNGYTYAGFNLKKPMFADVRVRRALSYATDREGLVNAVLLGQGRPLASIFKPGTWADNAALKPWPYDPAQARALLDEAGWRLNPATHVREKDGVPLAFTLTTNQGNDERLKTAQILQALWAEVGVKVDIKVQEWSTFITNTVKKRDFDMILLGWGLGVEPDPTDVWLSTKTKPDEFNIIGYANPRVDELCLAARKAFDRPTRKAMLDELQRILADDQPYLWLYAPDALMAVHKRIQGIVPAPAGIGYNQPDWWVPKVWMLR